MHLLQLQLRLEATCACKFVIKVNSGSAIKLSSRCISSWPPAAACGCLLWMRMWETFCHLQLSANELLRGGGVAGEGEGVFLHYN